MKAGTKSWKFSPIEKKKVQIILGDVPYFLGYKTDFYPSKTGKTCFIAKLHRTD